MKFIPSLLAGICLVAAGSCRLSAQESSSANGMLLNAISYINTPYQAGTLEVNPHEQLVINTEYVDCTTLVEYVLATTLAQDAYGVMFDQDFINWLTKIRYRNGRINGYVSRLHYVTEWVENGIKQGFLQDVTLQHSPYTLKVNLNYMTSHISAYPHLASNMSNVNAMRQIENHLSGTEVHYVPKDKVPSEGFDWIQNGDIILITTNVEGLDVTHMGIAVNIDGMLTLLHASSVERRVVVSNISLSEMLRHHRSWTGIRVIRMKK